MLPEVLEQIIYDYLYYKCKSCRKINLLMNLDDYNTVVCYNCYKYGFVVWST